MYAYQNETSYSNEGDRRKSAALASAKAMQERSRSAAPSRGDTPRRARPETLVFDDDAVPQLDLRDEAAYLSPSESVAHPSPKSQKGKVTRWSKGKGTKTKGKGKDKEPAEPLPPRTESSCRRCST